MAPPLLPKRVLSPEPPDTGKCVSGPTTAKGKVTRSTAAKTRQSPYNVDAARRATTREKARSEAHNSTDLPIELDTDMIEHTIDYECQEIANEGFHQLSRETQLSQNSNPLTPAQCSATTAQHNASTLMDGVKGLLDLTNDYLRMLEEKHPGVGANFLALLADGTSRAMRGERVYAEKAKPENSETKVYNLKEQNVKATPPKGQSREDRRVMIRLGPEHEARKTGAFELRQKVQELVFDKSLVSDVWAVPSAVAILAPTPALAAAILQNKTAIENRFGSAVVERQEKWTNFIIGPIPKKVRCLEGFRDPMDGLLSEELAALKEIVPIRYMNWTRRSQDDQPFGHIRISVPEAKSNKFPPRLRLFGEAVFVQRIRQRQQPIVCDKCYGFHTIRTCARTPKCKTCATEAHDGP
ncbi:hypothetical protein EPUL_006041, partial [Erysiphe pulchra]